MAVALALLTSHCELIVVLLVMVPPVWGSKQMCDDWFDTRTVCSTNEYCCGTNECCESERPFDIETYAFFVKCVFVFIVVMICIGVCFRCIQCCLWARRANRNNSSHAPDFISPVIPQQHQMTQVLYPSMHQYPQQQTTQVPYPQQTYYPPQVYTNQGMTLPTSSEGTLGEAKQTSPSLITRSDPRCSASPSVPLSDHPT